MKPLLLIAHPGHELRVFQWVQQVRPEVVMLTSGDGSIGQPRLEDSRHMLDAWGLDVRSDWLRPVSDAVVYQALLGTGASPFQTWLDDLTEAAMDAGIDTVVADEAEGYNPSHDLCRVLANRLVSRLREAGRSVRNLEIPLVGHPCDPAREGQVEIEVRLTEAELQQKLEQVLDYARRCSPVLLGEVQTMFDTFGTQAFGRECLYPAARTPYEDGRLPDTMPHFERVGEERKVAGIYKDVIRARHLLDMVTVVGHPG
ncbi:hypothetical protein [Hydrogenophaga sp. RWCD_12]|uniref:hypothetical protein n=1 Tax=Hydrogenophaga sp. RWCD_12 TaxID=3391190 RepID=UPI003985210B